MVDIHRPAQVELNSWRAVGLKNCRTMSRPCQAQTRRFSLDAYSLTKQKDVNRWPVQENERDLLRPFVCSPAGLDVWPLGASVQARWLRWRRDLTFVPDGIGGLEGGRGNDEAECRNRKHVKKQNASQVTCVLFWGQVTTSGCPRGIANHFGALAYYYCTWCSLSWLTSRYTPS